MKLISEQLAAHIAGEVTTLATCWRINRKDGIVLGFTSFDRDILYDKVLYRADTGFVPTAVSSSASLAVDNMEIEGVVDGVVISQEDIQAGLYDFAEVEVFLLNYKELGQGKLNLRTGWIGELIYDKGRFKAEVRGLMQKLVQVVGQLCSPSCRAKLGDKRCGVNMLNFKVSGAVMGVESKQVFIDNLRVGTNGYFSMGKITFTSGKNSGFSMEVKECHEGRINVVLPMPYKIEVGDSYVMEAGCDKSFATCIGRFNNALNFRGEPHVPGVLS